MAVQVVHGLAGAFSGGLGGEEAVVQPHGRVEGVGGRHPVHRRLHLAAIRRGPAPALGVVGGVHRDDVAVVVLLHLRGGDEVSASQADLTAGGETEVLRWWYLCEVILLDEQLPAEGNLPGAVLGSLGVVRHLEMFHDWVAVSVGGPVVQDQPQRAEHSHATLGLDVQDLPDIGLERFDGVAALGARGAHLAAEAADCCGRITAAAHP